jgi:hypothetical protein
MKARMPYLKPLSVSTMALLVIMVAGYLMSEPASAQRTPPPSDPVLDAVHQVQRSIAGLHVNVDALQSSLDAQLAPMAVNFRWTPAVSAANDLRCMVVNISGVDKMIQFEVKTRDGSTHHESMLNVAPGATGFIAIAARPQHGEFHCKFTVIGGTRADIRASLQAFDNGFHLHIPAE